jgi:hypothetical protein
MLLDSKDFDACFEGIILHELRLVAQGSSIYRAAQVPFNGTVFILWISTPWTEFAFTMTEYKNTIQKRYKRDVLHQTVLVPQPLLYKAMTALVPPREVSDCMANFGWSLHPALLDKIHSFRPSHPGEILTVAVANCEAGMVMPDMTLTVVMDAHMPRRTHLHEITDSETGGLYTARLKTITPNSMIPSTLRLQEMTTIVRKCNACEQTDIDCKLKSCGRCKKVKYCSKQCQARHWDQGHKQRCSA